jgi:hypothetical protein
MSTNYLSAFIKCPYYNNINMKVFSISCKDDTDNHTAFILSKIFKNKDALKSNLVEYCYEDYKKCEIYKLIESRIEQEKEV